MPNEYPRPSVLSTTHRASWLVLSFDPESEGCQKVVKLIIEKMTERAVAEASKRTASDGVVSSNGAPGGGDTADSPPDTPATQYAKQMPVLPLKLESRAGGLLVAWVQAAVILVDALFRAEET